MTSKKKIKEVLTLKNKKYNNYLKSFILMFSFIILYFLYCHYLFYFELNNDEVTENLCYSNFS